MGSLAVDRALASSPPVRAIIQRVSRASVAWREKDADHRQEIGTGLLILVGAGPDDSAPDADRLADKVAELRIFADDEGRFDRSLEAVGGEALVVPQFTLYADVSRGRRPSFTRAGPPGQARELCDRFAARLERRGIGTRSGRFGAHMTVSLDNDGPVTLAVSTDSWETRIGG